MDVRTLKDSDKKKYNGLVTHIMQSWEWGEFRKSLGLKLLRYGLFKGSKLISAFQLTFHEIPFTKKYVGYLPKGPMPDKNLADALGKIGKEENCAFIKVEPDIKLSTLHSPLSNSFRPSPKPLFTKYNFVLDITKSEEELLKNMHPKTRYNIKLAQKKGVFVEESDKDEALELYLDLLFETTKRQKFYNHNKDYHRKVFKVLRKAGMARLLIAFFRPLNSDVKVPLTAWMLVNFKDTIYYPYGGSSDNHRDLMASNLVAWEAIKLGKKLKLKHFDMWGALGPNADPNDPWYGFHRFKMGYGGELIEYVGSFDYILNYHLFLVFLLIDKLTPLKIFLLKLLNK